MVATKVEEMSAAKLAGEGIIGHNSMGGILVINNAPYALKHPYHRFTKDPTKPWGHPDGGYTKADLVPITMHVDTPSMDESAHAVSWVLEKLRQSDISALPTQGLEIEGAVYKKGTMQLAPAFTDPSHNPHAELMETTLETATGKLPNGEYPRSPVELAHQVSLAVLEAHEQAELEGNSVVHSSVPEGGNPYENRNTPVPYLQAFAPRVLADTVLHGGTIPQEAIDMYEKIGIPDVLTYLQESGILNWPINALHVHNGVPKIGEYADTRTAFAMGELRNTEMAKILSFMMYNTQYCYGADTGVSDVRSIMRRLLSTAHGGQMPQSVEQYIHEAVSALEEGSIHSLPRYPAHSQHDRIRIRMDGVTMESIDAPMNPDLRLVLGWSYMNQIMNVIALDAMEKTSGNETQVLPYLAGRFGELMNPIQAMGESQSSYAHDLVFNTKGYEGKAPWMKKNYEDSIRDIMSIFEQYAIEYPAIKTHVAIANRLLNDVIRPLQSTSLEEYFGVENGVYNPNGLNTGIVTDAKKKIGIQELIDVQSKATKLQAEVLTQISSESDLLAFFGI